MVRFLLTLLLAGSGCIDWGSLYADSDAGRADADRDPIDAAPSAVGCSDGSAEALLAETGLAACDGAWSKPGVVYEEPPACDRGAGNDGVYPSGEGCNVSDLCAVGWHVCRSAADVSAHASDTGCSDLKPPDPDGTDAYIYLTRQGGREGDVSCTPDGSTEGGDDAWGCGTLGIEATTCPPLDRHLALGEEIGGCGTFFDCGGDPAAEGLNVTKRETNGGGVLCCRDSDPQSP
jgi:hypothetical protein